MAAIFQEEIDLQVPVFLLPNLARPGLARLSPRSDWYVALLLVRGSDRA